VFVVSIDQVDEKRPPKSFFSSLLNTLRGYNHSLQLRVEASGMSDELKRVLHELE
jgi:hypothetical protein